jgi:hypothetical protein
MSRVSPPGRARQVYRYHDVNGYGRRRWINISEAEKTESCKRFKEVEVVQFSLFKTILVPHLSCRVQH